MVPLPPLPFQRFAYSSHLGEWEFLLAPPPLLLGRHVLALGVEPGPRVGEILRAVYEQQLDGVVATEGEAIDRARALVLGDGSR